MVRLALRNPSRRTWWIIAGTTAGAAAVGTTVWWLTRRRTEQPIVIPAFVGLPDASTGGPQRVPEDPTICQRWKTGNERRPWTAVEWAKVTAALDQAMIAHFRPFTSVSDARAIAFTVTAAALSALCPTWPVPSLQSQVDEYKGDPDLGFWWDAAWDAVYSNAWTRVVAAGGGTL